MNKELLDEAIKCLSIRDVTLSGTSVSLNDLYDPIYSSYGEISVQFRHGIKTANKKSYEDETGNQINILVFCYECAFRVLPPDLVTNETLDEETRESQTLVEAIAQFNAYYPLDKEISEEAVKEFSKYNVGYHVWPYWREYASSLAMRIRLPSFAVPFYRVPD